jgi:hypothetical protein
MLTYLLLKVLVHIVTIRLWKVKERSQSKCLQNRKLKRTMRDKSWSAGHPDGIAVSASSLESDDITFKFADCSRTWNQTLDKVESRISPSNPTGQNIEAGQFPSQVPHEVPLHVLHCAQQCQLYMTFRFVTSGCIMACVALISTVEG